MNAYLFVVVIFSFVVTFFAVPYVTKRLSKSGKTIADVYKKGRPQVPTNGAIVVFFAVLITCTSWPLISRIVSRTIGDSGLIYLDSVDTTILLVTSLFAIFGIIDDLLDLTWSSKIFFPLIFSFPIFIIYNPESLTIPIIGIYDMSTEIIFDLALSDFFKILVIPIYIMVVPNLINMHSGFNGLQTGLSSILLAAIIIKCVLDGKDENLLVPCSFLGGMLAFWYYNKYPARIFEGNIGSLSIGSIIGIVLVIKGYFFFGVFIMIPHIIDFLMLLFLKINGRPFVKFGSIDDEGILIVPNPIKMKFLLPYYFRMNEYQAVNSLYVLTIIFCTAGILL